MRIAKNRNVSIQTTNSSNILTIAQGSATNPIADAWTTYSSRRWKTNIATLDGALEMLLKLRGVTYNWKASGESDIGLIAEEVGQVVPEIVVYEENGRDARSVAYGQLVPILIEAVKEQQSQIDTQQEQLAAQQTAIEILTNRLEKLEQQNLEQGHVYNQ